MEQNKKNKANKNNVAAEREMICHKSKKGSITIETTIVILFVFFCIIFAIFASIRLYRTVSIQVAADLAAQRGACTWDNINKDINTGKIRNTRNEPYDLYWRIYDIRKDPKIVRIVNWLLSHPNRDSLIKMNERTAVVEMKDYIVLKKLQIEVKNMISGEKAFAGAVVIEPAEFIRNTDFLVEAAGDIMKYFSGVNNAIERLKKLINDIKHMMLKEG